MKFQSSCSALAATLSANYLSKNRYNPTTSVSSSNDNFLKQYLSNNGVLVTMCMGNFCAIDEHIDHISGSWIQDDTTNFRVIGMADIGYILDPINVSYKCLYPTDAATIGRSNYGCGPIYDDPIYGDYGYNHSNVITRYIHKKSLERFEQLNFGSSNISKIPCNKRYMAFGRPGKHSSSPVTWSYSNTTTTRTESNSSNTIQSTSSYYYTYSTLIKTRALYDEPYVGRPTCDINNEIPYLNDTNNMLLYYDNQSWDPIIDWQNVIDMMQNEFSKYNIRFWNEIVVDIPKRSMNDIVMAVFILIGTTNDDIDNDDNSNNTSNRSLQDYQKDDINDLYQRAVIEASILDGTSNRKPILFANITALKHNLPLFTCADDVMDQHRYTNIN